MFFRMAEKSIPETWYESVDILKTSAYREANCDNNYECNPNVDGRNI